MRAWVIYSLVRVGLFLALFAVLLLLGIEWWIAAVAAALMGLALSFLVLGRLRDRVTADLAEARARREAGIRDSDEDESAEDRD